MNVERLHAIAAALRVDLDQSSVLSHLQNLVSALSSQVSQPGQPQYQQQTSQHLTELLAALEKAEVDNFPPTWQQVLEEIGAKPLTGAQLAASVRSIFAQNQITPSVAQQLLQKLLTDLQTLSSSIDQLLAGLQALSVGSEDLEPGECELGVLVPRAFLDNRLDRFASELDELNQIFSVFAEVATGSRPGFEIKTISSTDLSVYLEVAAIVGACIATAVERIVALYKQLLEIRKIQGDLVLQGVDRKNLEGLEKHANGVMEAGIDKLVKELLADFHVKGDANRKNELTIELKFSLKKIANRIDRGFNIEVRMEEPEPASASQDGAAEEKALLAAHSKIAEAAHSMQFLKLEGEPILQLTEGKAGKTKAE